MEKAKRFEDLWVWQQARQLVREIYGDCRRSRARNEFALCNHLQRAGLSVMNNLAEGFERATDADFARFLDLAKGSCGEVRSLYYAAEDLGFVKTSDAEARRTSARRIAAGIASLTAYLRRK